jgi:hypothetical protein
MVRTIAKVIALSLAGVIVATVGVGAHRALGYVGVTLALVLVAVAGVFARTWARFAGYTAYAAGWFVATAVYNQQGPGNSRLIWPDAHGAVWLYGAAVVLVLIALVPRRWLEGRDVAT